jgi:hypothetical protein
VPVSDATPSTKVMTATINVAARFITPSIVTLSLPCEAQKGQTRTHKRNARPAVETTRAYSETVR